MSRPEIIRPDFLQSYFRRYRVAWTERYEAIRASEDAVRQLNLKFGVPNSSSFSPELGQNYIKEYQSIQSYHRPIYEEISDREKNWKLASDITIPEYLYVDDFGDELSEIVERSDSSNLGYDRLLEIKAGILIAKWKEHRSPFVSLWEQRAPSAGQILDRVEIEIANFKYPRKRCIDHFRIPFWELPSMRQIERFKNAYAMALRSEFYRAKLA